MLQSGDHQEFPYQAGAGNEHYPSSADADEGPFKSEHASYSSGSEMEGGFPEGLPNMLPDGFSMADNPYDG